MTQPILSAAPARRVFRYGQHEIPDPGPEYSPEQVCSHLTTYFPELAQAKTDEQTLADGTVEITFRKQVTTKAGQDG
jgi:PRTRC genetic system protein C